ncbi:gliding motility-associated C-terminal domain-containing protein [Mucilaginibacter flavus]|uniref:gliding motility-associated C-terminal domain-containing protein n=1 Tax=Mucilaginibacter flavus TaxID=931504 RepID=UPI0025B54624|nr:gliding motility-associated C-terminal domain-containing protein [Mucilaginibacter flavus]MDN3580844.1 gliding motility-associated C-terminal domain-containing protein [Mucilaginibacter flavus]
MYLLRYWLLLLFTTFLFTAHAQQDVDLHLNDSFFPGKNILKVKRDFRDPYLWVLAQNHQVYRINSITKSIDDYSGSFNAYHNLQFTDLAGISKDTVVISTNTNTLIINANNTVKTFNVDDNNGGKVQGIGVENMTGSFPSSPFYPYTDLLAIATTKRFLYYAIKENTLTPTNVDTTNVRFYQHTYRNRMSGYGYPLNYGDTVNYYNVTTSSQFTTFGGYVWLGGNSFGKHVLSAFYNRYSSNTYYDTDFEYYANIFWATENGLFQLKWSQSYGSQYPHNHYLKGQTINYITSMVGLTDFNDQLTHENLLIATNNGLYFSNSNYKKAQLTKYQFFHYDELGNKTINDICVNATSYTSPVCEDGIWIGAADGLYLIKPDYGKYVNTTNQIKAVQFDGQDADVSNYNICNGTTIKATVNNYIYSGSLIQWYKNGTELPGESKTALTINSPGDYYALLYDPCSALHLQTNHLTVTQIAAPVFTFNYPDVVNYCAGTSAQLKTDDKPNYQYRWYKDGVLNGNTTATQDNITETGKYKIEVSACESSWVASKEVQINFISIPTPVLTTDKTSYCDGDLAVLSASVPIDGSNIINWTGYQYSWFKDGSPIIGSVPSIKVGQPGKYKVVVSGCSGSVSSAELQVDFAKLDKPLITADKAAYCIGDNAQLNTNISFDPFTTNIIWFKDGAILTDAQNKTNVTTNQPGTYVVNLFDNTKQCQISSASYNLTFTPPPTLSIQQFVNSSLCSGETVDLKASYTSGTIKWSTGETTDKISVKSSGTYQATVTTPAGCTVVTTSTVQFLPNPTLNVPDATLCQYTKESITLTAPAGFVKYEWNGQAGSTTFTTDKLGQVSLTVTDNNGCRATQTITISSHCDDIHVPNAFSPNGDGHNDTWVIAGLEGDLSTTVKVYNRLGSQIFISQGYSTPWNGSYKGQKLPAGVYYYVISAKGSKQVLSGSVTIIY